jgi:ribosomal protein S18 acetylase RimI-like enzyme
VTPAVVRPATDADLGTVAHLHRTRISEGFLSYLGEPFLRRLYRRVLRSTGGFVLVADTDDTRVAGFAAGAADLGRLYRSFVLRDGVVAGSRAAPRILRSLPRVLETLRYPSGGDGLPTAEILAVAVSTAAAGRGVGLALVRAALERFAQDGVDSAKVVTGSDNAAALALYRRAGFEDRARIAVHEGTASEVLVWSCS